MPFFGAEVFVAAALLGAALVVGFWAGRLRSSRKVAALSHKVEELSALLAHSRRVETLGRFAGGIAHDFNNLLTVILGHAELVASKLTRLGVQGIDTQELISATARAAGLTQQLLAFSRHKPLRPALWELEQVIEAMKPMLRSLVGERYTLSFELSPGESVLIDRSQFEQVVLNLVLNAREALGPSGSITIRTGETVTSSVTADGHREVFVEVIDTGAGMDEETVKRIFEPFFTTKEQGTGLGLATTWEIVENAGGRIEVQSKRGEGTTMRVILPPGEAPAERGVSLQRVGGIKFGTESVLVVEDEKTVARLVQIVLEQAGYSVVSAESAAEALKLLEQRPAGVDLLLTDVVMANKSGVELAKEVRAKFPHTKVLLMSASVEPEVRRNGSGGRDANGWYLLEKPFSPSTLAEKVRAALDSKPEPSVAV